MLFILGIFIVTVTDFLLLNQSVLSHGLKGVQADVSRSTAINQNKPLVLTHSDNVFSFEFAALHYADPSRNQYAYKLNGFDPHWIVTSAARRLATYTNIPAGNIPLVCAAVIRTACGQPKKSHCR
jgi:hypothetical protein